MMIRERFPAAAVAPIDILVDSPYDLSFSANADLVLSSCEHQYPCSTICSLVLTHGRKVPRHILRGMSPTGNSVRMSRMTAVKRFQGSKTRLYLTAAVG